jgi:hypothetical protein
MKALLIVFFSLAVFTATAQKKEMENIRFAMEVLRLALLSGDRAQLMQITTADLSYGHSSGLIESRDEFVEKLASGKSDFVTLNISEPTITLYKNTAVVRHLLDADTNDSGKVGHISLKVLLVWVKTNSGWLLAARQAVKQQP